MDRSSHEAKRRQSPHVESLEGRALLSVLINAQPTLQVVPQGHRIQASRGTITIVQPTPITVKGTAQPPASNVAVVVQIFAKDVSGNLVNGGAPLATATPDFLGQYTATFALPSRLRKDVNTLFAREVAVGSLGSSIRIDPTTLAGLGGSQVIDGTTLRNLIANVNNPSTTATLNGTVSTQPTAILGMVGSISTLPFPITGGIAGPAFSTLVGTGGTLGPLVGTIAGATISSPPSTSNLADGTAAIDPTTGSFTQAGTAAIAGTTGSSTLLIDEVAVSEPVTVRIHQSRNGGGTTAPTRARGRAMPTGPRALAVGTIRLRGPRRD